MTNQHTPATAHDNPGEPHDPTRSADGQTARRLTNTSGEYSLERARHNFDNAHTSGRNREGERRGGGGAGGGALLLLSGLGLGAALMYLLDPEHGVRRREQLSERLAGLSNRTADLAGKTTRGLRERTQGVVAQAGGLFRGEGHEGGGRQQQEQTGSEETGAGAAAGAGTSSV
jgi:uncharacterized protein HemX